ncbi:histidine phosphatase family protein [Pseudoneobacillus sp. C159]
MTTICLIRHGETEWNALRKLQGRTDIPLNSKGIQQAQECRDYLIDSEFDVLISSPLKRARQTADIINEVLNLPILEMDEFQERFYGDAEGMTKEERIAAFPDKNYSNQESLESLNNRVNAGIDNIYQHYPDKKILLVAHGGVINSILSIFSNGEIGSGKTRLMNACISNVHFHEEKWVIKNFNQVNHLSSSHGK